MQSCHGHNFFDEVLEAGPLPPNLSYATQQHINNNIFLLLFPQEFTISAIILKTPTISNEKIPIPENPTERMAEVLLVNAPTQNYRHLQTAEDYSQSQSALVDMMTSDEDARICANITAVEG